MENIDMKALEGALSLVRNGQVKRVDVSDKVSVYRVGTVVRIDIKD
jgi:hypothetical protein